MRLIIIFLILFFSIPGKNFGQKKLGKYDTIRTFAIIDQYGDTIPFEYLPSYDTQIKVSKKYKKLISEWTRLRNAIYVTYPYAVLCSDVIKEINKNLEGIKDLKQRKKIIKNYEKQLKEKFSEKLKKLSVYQGRVLMKLIYRQTHNNCYEIIKEYKGGFSAFISQSIMVLFGGNLKLEYDSTKKDRDMEIIVLEYEKMHNINQK